MTLKSIVVTSLCCNITCKPIPGSLLPSYGYELSRVYRLLCYKVTKKFSKGKQAHVGMEPSNKMRTTPQHINTIPTSCAILETMLCASCVHRRVVEGSGEGSGGCVVHVDVHGECVMFSQADWCNI